MDWKPIIIPLPEPSEEDEEICITNLAEELNLDSEVSACLSNVNNDNIFVKLILVLAIT